MENPIKMDDLGGTTIFGNIQIGDERVTVIESPSGSEVVQMDSISERHQQLRSMLA